MAVPVFEVKSTLDTYQISTKPAKDHCFEHRDFAQKAKMAFIPLNAHQLQPLFAVQLTIAPIAQSSCS